MKRLGERLRAARLARNLKITDVAAKIGTGPRAVSDAEFGKPGVSAAVVVALLWTYDLLSEFELLADPAHDVEGLARVHARERARTSSKGALDNDF